MERPFIVGEITVAIMMSPKYVISKREWHLNTEQNNTSDAA